MFSHAYITRVAKRRRFQIIFDHRCIGVHDVANGSQFALAGCSDRELLVRHRTRADRPEHLRAFQHQLYGPVGLSRSQGRQHHVRPTRPLAAESTANEEGDDADIFRRDTKCFASWLLASRNILRRIMDGQLVAVPFRDRGVRLHGIVVLDGSRVDFVDLDGRLTKAFVHVAPTDVSRFVAVLAGVGRGETCHEIEFRRRFFVCHAHQRRGVGGLMQGFRDHEADGLIVVMDAVLQ